MNRRPKKFRLLIITNHEEQILLSERAFLQILPTGHIDRALTAHEAVQILNDCIDQEWDFPSLMLDLYLPKREDGWQVLKTIRSLPAPLNHVPVVMLDNSTRENDIQEAYQNGCTSYMIKPSHYTVWLDYFQTMKTYWLDTATLPHMPYST